IITSLVLAYDVEDAPMEHMVTQNGFLYAAQTSAGADGFAPFASVSDLTPQIYADPDPAFYLGFDAAFPGQPVSLYIAAAARAFSGATSTRPGSAPAPREPLRWEYFNGTAWRKLTVVDDTYQLGESGMIEFLTPPDIAPLQKFFDLAAR